MPNRPLAKLVAEGRIRPGDQLFHPVRRLGQPEVVAHVVAGGVEVDGKVYPSPSTAARTVTGYSTNGWTFWRLKKTGETIGVLRSREG